MNSSAVPSNGCGHLGLAAWKDADTHIESYGPAYAGTTWPSRKTMVAPPSSEECNVAQSGKPE
jgi:hypothetical protein